MAKITWGELKVLAQQQEWKDDWPVMVDGYEDGLDHPLNIRVIPITLNDPKKLIGGDGEYAEYDGKNGDCLFNAIVLHRPSHL